MGWGSRWSSGWVTEGHSFQPNDWFDFKRGKEIRNDYLLPLSASGFYDYSITEDSISLRWQLSSNSQFMNYYFKLDSQKEQIEIGNFFGDTLDYDEILFFEKIWNVKREH